MPNLGFFISSDDGDALLSYRGDDLSDPAAVLHRLDGAADGVADPPDDPGERTLLSVVVVVPKIPAMAEFT